MTRERRMALAAAAVLVVILAAGALIFGQCKYCWVEPDPETFQEF